MVATGIKQTIDELLRDWERRFNSNDTDGLAQLYTADAYLMPPDANAILGRSGIAGFWRGARENGVKEIRLHIGDVVLEGEIALEISTATLTVQGQNGRKSEVPVKYVVAWKRQADGGWELMVDIWNSTQAA